MKELFGDLEDNHEIFHASCEARSHLNYLISKQQLVKSVNDENNDNLDDSLEGEEVGGSPPSEWY